MKRALFLFLMILFTTSVTIASASGIPKTINYQGYLTDSNGQPFTGTKQVVFSLYDGDSGGTALWTETIAAVTVTNGRLSVVLGNITPIEPSIFKGDTYLGMKVGSDSISEMAPRQKLTSVPYAMTVGSGGIPKGGIIMWYGSIPDIPEGWALCDGIERTASDGTKITPPNLRDRFVVGAGSGYAVAATGGEATHILTINEMPSHTHIQDPHTHTQDAHSHTAGPFLNYTRAQGTKDDFGKGWSENTKTTTSTVATNQNTTATNQNTGGGAAHNNLPPYYALAYIMKL